VLCRSQAAALDSPFSSDIYASDFNSIFGSIKAGLWQCRPMVGLLVHLYSQLESVINAGARLIYRLRFSDHISDALVSLHWLRSPERVMVKVAVVMFKAIHGSAPTYLRRLVRVADLYLDVVPSALHVLIVSWFCCVSVFVCVSLPWCADN